MPSSILYLVKPALQDGGSAVLVVVELAVEGVGQDDAHAAWLGSGGASPEEGVRASTVVLEALDPEKVSNLVNRSMWLRGACPKNTNLPGRSQQIPMHRYLH